MNASSPEIILGHYEVIKSIAGGMGIVYLCRDAANDNAPVAIKAIQSKYIPNIDSRQRFLREISVWVELGWHPNIVQAFGAEYETWTHTIYLALELVATPPGKKDPSLRSRISPASPMYPGKALKLCLDVARGMNYATTKIPGLVHRDLKPENILIGVDGLARVTDFGLVKAGSMQDTAPGATQKETSEGLGTPPYMSPEQWRNENTDARSDIYGFGCVAYELFTGQQVVAGDTLVEMAQRHVNGEAVRKASTLNVHARVRDFIAKCVEPEPRNRYQAWQEVEAELVGILKEAFDAPVARASLPIDVSLLGQVRKGESLLALGNAYLDVGKPAMALKSYGEAMRIAEAQGLPDLLAACHANTGICFFSQGEFRRAISEYERAIQLDIGANLIYYAAMNYGNIGNAHFQLGEFDLARRHFEKAIEFARDSADRQTELFWTHNLANVLSATGQDKEALELYRCVLQFAEQHADTLQASSALGGLGIVYDRLGDPIRSREAFEKAIRLAVDNGDQKTQLSCMFGLSHLLAKASDNTGAVQWLECSLAIAQQTSDNSALAQVYCELGALGLMSAQLDAASRNLSEAIALATHIGNRNILSRALWSMGLLHEVKMEFLDAIKFERDAVVHFKELGLPEYVQASEHLRSLRKQHGLI